MFVAAFGEAALPIIPFQVIPDPPDRPITTAPEPATLAIVGPGLLAVGIHARRRRRRAR